MTARPTTWVVGSGGLLGSSVRTELARRGDEVLTSAVPWSDPEAAVAALRHGARTLVERADGGPWRLAWCAGSGVTGTPQGVLDAENGVLTRVLDELAESAGPGAARGTVFHASSAGAVYAGVAGAPHTELSAVRPLAPYGRAKLAAEQVVLDFGSRTGATVVVGRLSNLYGPGQNLAKAQGLISHLCRAFLVAQPVSIYVSLDTIRDYLFVTDAAAMVADTLDGAAARGERSTTKIYSAGRGTTIGAVLAECRSVFRRRPRVVLAASELASAQARDLRLRSVVWTELDARPQTPLAVGIASTLDSTRRALLG
ncbi:NAD(P)-dependent oxidoreductase [Rhodococcus antarcticus]|uniref:NAD(P)-dependent oxidoreductase n=1 Tax=Rhodococcus antarcticus TaxID=2987751 RepID=A0ABY6NZL2_9NOCA|nr:NAD(P)-dependent oxidoreductase [Rhodococcus antarcticus]UZJ24546.1 NAD(P)-dependent oxidoreductase [Rhodococcus antarcticus]